MSEENPEIVYCENCGWLMRERDMAIARQESLEKALKDTNMVAHNLHCELNAVKEELEKAKKAYDLVTTRGEEYQYELYKLARKAGNWRTTLKILSDEMEAALRLDVDRSKLFELLYEICDLHFNVERHANGGVGECEIFEAHRKLRRMIGYKMPYPGYDEETEVLNKAIQDGKSVVIRRPDGSGIAVEIGVVGKKECSDCEDKYKDGWSDGYEAASEIAMEGDIH